MLTINKVVSNGTQVTLILRGRIDSATSSSLEVEARHVPEGTTFLCFDLTGVDYLSSAGLRVILAAQKRMGKTGKMVLKGVCPAVKEIFDITGFTPFMNFV